MKSETILLFSSIIAVVIMFYNSIIKNQKLYASSGGFFLSPIPYILITFILIFAYRPAVIFFLNASTLDFEYFDAKRIIWVIQLSLISLIAILIPYQFSIKKTIDNNSLKNNLILSRARLLSLTYLITSIIVLSGILIYGSALTNTGIRFHTPQKFKFYFIFIICQRIHLILSAICLYCYIKSKNREWMFIIAILLLASPVIALFSSGRGSAILMIMTYGIMYAFTKNINLSYKKTSYIIIIGLVLLYLNFILGKIRIIMRSPDFRWANVSYNHFGLKNILVDLSWDYSVFDVTSRIVHETQQHLFGLTNFQYLLSYIPRYFWPEKPLNHGFMLYLTSTFYHHVFTENGSTFAGTIIGEGYLNFGVIGVFLYSIIFSWIVYFVYIKTITNPSPTMIILYSLTFPFVQFFIRNGLDFISNCFFSIFIPLIILIPVFVYQEKPQQNSAII